jgi:hypothetical protein
MDLIGGTGIAVLTGGQIVTCAHVLEEVGINPHEENGAEIGVYFPQVRSGEKKSRRAVVAGCFPQHDDDVVLLQLQGGPAPLAPEQIAVLGSAEDSFYNSFRSYGFRRLDYYIAGHAHGMMSI